MRNRKLVAILIIAFSLAAFIAEFILFSLHTEPSFENLRNIKLHYDITWKFWLNSRYYPPFWDYFWHAFILAFGPRFIYTSIANALFIVLGATFVYLLLREEKVDVDFAALGFAMTLLLPTSLFAAIRVRVEAMMWVLSIGFLYFLVKSRVFTIVKNSIFAAILVSLGLLGKWSFLAYSLLPALIESLTPVLRPLKKLYGLIAFGVTGAILCGPWYLFIMSPERILPSATNDPNLPIYSFLGMVKLNLFTLANEVWGTLLFGLSFAAIVAGLIFGRSKTLWLLASSIVGAIIFFSIPSHTEDRYFWPIVPMLAAATILGVNILIKRFKGGRFVVPFLFCAALFNAAINWTLFFTQNNHNSNELVMNKTYNVPKNTYGRYHEFLLKSPEYTKKPRPLISFYPPLQLLFLDWSYPQYLELLSPQPVPYEFAHFDLTEYWFFQEELRGLKYDVILMNCGKLGDCDGAFNEFLKTDLNRLRQPYYQPGMTEAEIKIFDPKTIIDDYDFVLANYRPVDRYEAIEGHVIVMWVKK